MQLDIILLSFAKDDDHVSMTKRCIESYLTSGDQHINKITILESNKNFDATTWNGLSPKIQTIVPPYNFNYNQFLNIGLKHCASDIICVTNSDVVVREDCVDRMMQFFASHPDAASASPVDRSWHQNTYDVFPKDDEVYWGYLTTKYLLGFCLFMRRSVYDIIGAYDEQFDFYHQDNDYEMCLKHNNLKHAMVTSCHIKHGEDKPDTGVTHEETILKLQKSEKQFFNKWLHRDFKPFKKVSFVAAELFTSCDDVVEVITDAQQSIGQYVVHVDTPVSIEDQQHILHLLGYSPVQLVCKGLTITKQTK